MRVPIDDEGNRWFQSLSHTFNNIKEDFVTARYLYYQSQSEDNDLIEISSMTDYMDCLDYADFGIRSGFLKSSLRLSVDLLDKCAVFFNEYLKLGHNENHVCFWNIWYNDLKYKKSKEDKNINPSVQLILDSNFFFAAIYDLQKDLINKSSPYPFPYKELRNDATHKRLILSWYGSLDEEIKSYSLKEFQQVTYSFLKIAKAAIIYLSGTVTLCESELLLEAGKTRDLEDEYSHPFQVNSGLSDQEFISLNK